MLDLTPLWLSLKTSAVATVITFFLGIAAAGWMHGYQGKARGLIDAVFTLPLVLPPTVVGFLLLVIFGRNGPLGQLLTALNLQVVFSWSATVIASTVVAFPLMYRATLGAFEQVNPALIQASETLGAAPRRVFWRITLPLALPGVVAATILSFARALGEFGATLMLAGNIPGRTQTIPLAIFFNAEAGKMDRAFAWVIIIIAIALATIAALNYWSTNSQRGHWRESRGGTSDQEATDFLHPVFRSGWGSPKAAPISPRAPAELLVELHKQLPQFCLNLHFTTDHQPLGLLGASGSGKTMLLRCIAGLETPNRGRVVLNHRVLFDAEQGINIPSYRRKIGFVFQNYALFPHMTVAQNIAFGLQKLPKQERSRRVAQQLTGLYLEGLGDRYPRQLSGGQQQRVALARALVTEPEALLLDEPFSALDTHLRSQLEQQLIEIFLTYQGIALFVTHNLEEAYRVCPNLLVMHQGQAIAQGDKQPIFERPATYTVARLTGCKNFSRAILTAPDTIRAMDWDCDLHILEPAADLAYVGIRAHHLTFVESPQLASQLQALNLFPCWWAASSETPHRVTLYLKLHQAPAHSRDYHIQAEVYKEKWATLKDRPLPWLVCLDPLRLMLLQQDSELSAQ